MPKTLPRCPMICVDIKLGCCTRVRQNPSGMKRKDQTHPGKYRHRWGTRTEGYSPRGELTPAPRIQANGMLNLDTREAGGQRIAVMIAELYASGHNGTAQGTMGCWFTEGRASIFERNHGWDGSSQRQQKGGSTWFWWTTRMASSPLRWTIAWDAG